MQIRTRMCMSADGYVTRPDGWPAQLAAPAWDPETFGFVELQASCDAVLMGRTMFEPALGADRWPRPDLDVFVLGSRRPPARWTTSSPTATRRSCWRRCGRRITAATSTWSALHARSRRSGASKHSTSSA
jgi:dihydrofolate reductase